MCFSPSPSFACCKSYDRCEISLITGFFYKIVVSDSYVISLTTHRTVSRIRNCCFQLCQKRSSCSEARSWRQNKDPPPHLPHCYALPEQGAGTPLKFGKKRFPGQTIGKTRTIFSLSHSLGTKVAYHLRKISPRPIHPLAGNIWTKSWTGIMSFHWISLDITWQTGSFTADR